MRVRSLLLSSCFCLLANCGSAQDEHPVEAPVEEVADSAPEAAPETASVDSVAIVDTAVEDASKDAAKPCGALDPRTSEVVVSVLPDAGETPYVDLLSRAKSSIRVFGYMMGYGAILDTLTAKARAGIDVRVILDGVSERDVNDKYRIALEAAGAKVQWSDPKFPYMHAKAIVVDERDAIVSTGNYSKSFILKERNYVARVNDPNDVGDLVALFEADWTKTSPSLACTRLLVSPINSQERIVALVKSAKTSIDVESMQFAERDVHDAVLERKAAGVSVRVLLATPTWITANAAAGADLKKNGIDARYLASPSVHVKAIVVDGTHAYLGSENLSYTSLAKNREVGLIVSDTAALSTMHATFESDWSKATSF